MRVAVAALQSSELDGTHQASEASLLDPSWRNAPADAIYFDGVVSVESQGSTLWRLWPTVLLAAVTASGILLLVATMIRGWYTAAVVLVGALLIASGYLENQLRAWWSTHRQPISWRQHGWVAEHRIYSVMAGKEYYDNWQVVAGVSHDSENLTITWRDHSELRISRQHLGDPEQWNSLLHLADAEKGVGHFFGELG